MIGFEVVEGDEVGSVDIDWRFRYEMRLKSDLRRSRNIIETSRCAWTDNDPELSSCFYEILK